MRTRALPLLLIALASCLDEGSSGSGAGGAAAPPCERLQSCPEGRCGEVPDGCGGVLSCTTDCGDPTGVTRYCQFAGDAADGVCVETGCPTCESLRFECGTVEPAGCPALDCGRCPPLAFCRLEDGQAAGSCSSTYPTCRAEGLACGTLYATDPDTPCGRCSSGACNAGRCPCGEERMTEYETFLAGAYDPTGPRRSSYDALLFGEADGLHVVFTTNAFNPVVNPPDGRYTALATARVDDQLVPIRGTVELLPWSEARRGYVGKPNLAPNGRELAFNASWDDGQWDDEELWLSLRAGPGAPFEQPVPLAPVGLDADRHTVSPLWLDDRTLLVGVESVQTGGTLRMRPHVIRRSAGTPGSTDFVFEESVQFDDPPPPIDGIDPRDYDLGALRFSCDRAWVIYTRQVQGRGTDVRRIPITIAEDGTPSFGAPEAYPHPLADHTQDGRVVSSWAEHPNCDQPWVLFGEFDLGTIYKARRDASCE